MATRHFRTLVVLAITFSILSLSYLSLHTSSSIHDWESPTTAKESNLDDKATFVKAILENEFDSEFDPAPIKKVCDRTQWHAGLIFTCTPPQGGIGNVRNVFLNCIRYAMEAGGMFLSHPAF